MISKEKAERLKKTPLAYQPLKNRTAAKTAPYFYDDAMKEIEKKLGMTREQLATSGLRVYTTLDKRMQRIAENTVAHTIRTGSDIQVGFSAIDPATGRVLALLGGRDYEKARLTGRHRRNGSPLPRSSRFCTTKRFKAALHRSR